MLDLAAALVLPLILLGLFRVTMVCKSGENSMDSYYHAAMAELGPQYFTAKKFPHLTMSTWTNNFSDKELGYHLLLWGIFRGQEAVNGPVESPFHFPALVMMFLLIATFVLVCYGFGIGPLWVYSLLLTLLSPWFALRILMLRPHVLGIILIVLGCLVFARIKTFRHLWAAAAVGFLMAWSYSNPHFILLPAAAFAVGKGLKRPLLGIMIVVAALGGIVLGFILHPQFPNTFINWKIQCFDVYREMLFANSPVVVGDELYKGGIYMMALNFWFILLVIANLTLFFLICRTRSWKFWKLPAPAVALFLLGTLTFAGALVRVRMLEYAVPVNLLALGIFHAYFRRRKLLPKIFTGNLVTVFAIGVIIACGAYILTLFPHYKHPEYKPFTQFAKWTREKQIPRGEIIANVCWSDFPALLYSVPRYRFLYGLDPMFGYFHSPKKVEKIEQFRTGKINLTPKELREIAGTPLVFVSAHGWKLAKHLDGQGYKLIYQGNDGWLFYLGN